MKKAKVVFIQKQGNSFGDQILHYSVNGQHVVESFPEGNWVDPEEYRKILEEAHAKKETHNEK